MRVCEKISCMCIHARMYMRVFVCEKSQSVCMFEYICVLCVYTCVCTSSGKGDYSDGHF